MYVQASIKTVSVCISFYGPPRTMTVYCVAVSTNLQTPSHAEGFCKHTRLAVGFMLVAKHVCLSVYVSFSMTRRGFSNIHAYANLHFLICLWWLSVYVWACMFSFPWQVEGFQTYMHARHIFIFVSTSDFERVCLIAHFAFSMTSRGFSNIHTYTLIPLILKVSIDV